ncbi:MAG: hypothetical protein R3E18_01015 [Sphingomonadaceae bacterium]
MLCASVELAARAFQGKQAFAFASLAMLGLFLLIWAELAVGIF